MAPGGKQLLVVGIGHSQVLTIARLHDLLGLTRAECVERLLRAPAVLIEDVSIEQGERLQAALTEAGLNCELVDEAPDSGRADHEIAAYITRTDHLPQFAAEVAAFTGQSADQVLDNLCKTPAMILGRLSRSVATELVERFAQPGIELMTSNPTLARYTAVAYAADASPSSVQHFKQIGLRPAATDRDVSAWEARDIAFSQAQQIWHKANELHLPLVLQNHDFMRFDIHLLQASGAGSEALASLLHDCGIPRRLHARVLDHLPVVIERCQPVASAEARLEELRQLGAKAEAVSLAGTRFDLQLNNWRQEQTQPLLGLCQRVLHRAIALPRAAHAPMTLPLSANLHQSLWIKHECEQLGLKGQLTRAAG